MERLRGYYCAGFGIFEEGEKEKERERGRE